MNSIFFLGGQFAPDGGGQFESDCIGLLNHLRGGQFDRCLHPFTVSARTARLIGRENVSNAEGALIELVKNCYDADSKAAIVLIDKPNDTILVLDSGDGMTDQIIREQWMTIGTDSKLKDAITISGRVKAGAKGIGRFALDRLGEHCTMITFPIHNTKGYKWIVNWGDFEENINGNNIKINEVFADLTTIENTTFKKELLKEITNKEIYKQLNKEIFNKGTLLKITGLRDEWRDASINKIFENLNKKNKKYNLFFLFCNLLLQLLLPLSRQIFPTQF